MMRHDFPKFLLSLFLWVSCIILQAYPQEMDTKCKELITSHQDWMNQTENYVYRSTVFDHTDNEVGTSETLVDFLSGKKYSLSIDAKKGLDAFTEGSVVGGGSTINVRNVGKTNLPGSSDNSDQGYGDGTKGIFVRGYSPAQTIQRFTNITEGWQCVDGVDKRQGLLGLQFRHNEKYINQIKSSLTEESLGSQQLADTAKNQIDMIGSVIMWFSPGEGGAFRGIDVFGKNLPPSSPPISSVFVQNTHRNLNGSELGDILKQLQSQIRDSNVKTYSNVAELSTAADQYRLSTRISPLRWVLIISGCIMILLGVYGYTKRYSFAG